MTIFPVILSGGTGSRLWPKSRALNPKQFLPLVDNKTMFQNTVSRLDTLDSVSAPLVIANEDHRFLVAEQLRLMGKKAEAIILEPFGRNTAPAVALASLKLLQSSEQNQETSSHESDQDPLLLVLAADHVIRDLDAFRLAVENALPAAKLGKLVTFGIVPTHAETGYGYIKAGSNEINSSDVDTDNTFYPVQEFVEKPDIETAHAYLSSGEYFWNSGMFLFKASRYLEELNKFRPDILSVCKNAMDSQNSDLDFVRVDQEMFESCPDDSIDYAVMEKTSDAVVVPLDAGWSDVGSWTSLAEISEKDELGNACLGDVILHDTRNSYVRSDKRLIATIGVDDLVVVDSDDAILVAHKNNVQDVKKVVEKLKAQGRSEANLHRKVYRPWGAYDSVDMGDRFQVKRIIVKPGAKLSLQKHFHRAEHWVVVKGTALVEIDGKEILLTENQSTYIPIGSVHRLENPGKLDLELIEVQSGSYLGEDDIVRFEDNYGRS
ncbi:mannose-1-phosphate guanylyltransferase/mannose-6-phosphate isomerase [Endozoicomonas elysicola]|uniref:mannose-1-phosphate guanylyltransferase n=1 Tax=Endozoicomonas elysicola TaxID=305900 RepID=A0A081KCS2_9GAMM|nr:mannose-1-phosphate guanylyltransferase/mannose-6-phosphate isomerase [Endozoicomonas elysicola]KEI71948.1 mannose-1-phosphate guanyltransferase [Endozoicomonas elysicola]